MNQAPAVPVASLRLSLRSALTLLTLFGASLVCLFAQSAVFTGIQTTIASSASLAPVGLAVDGVGDVFYVDSSSSSVIKVPAAGGAKVTVASSLSSPQGVAVDQTGDVFISQAGGGGSVIEMPWTGTAYGAKVSVASGLTNPEGVAVDPSGDVFIANNFGGWVLEVPHNLYGTTQETMIGSGLSNPKGIALDAFGDLYIADSGNNRVVEVFFNGMSYSGQATLASALNSPWGLVLDSQGDLYIADSGNNRVVELPATSGGGFGAKVTVAAAVKSPSGLAVDPRGNFYIGDAGNHRVVEWQPQSVNFGSLNVCPAGQASPAPCSRTMTLNFQVTPDPTTLGVSALTMGAENLDFTFDAAGSSCAASPTAGETCSIPVTFAPLYSGLRAGALQLFDAESGEILATVPVYGVGSGPQIAYSSNAQSLPGLNLVTPTGVAVDGQGDVFISDAGAENIPSVVVEIPAGGAGPVTVASGFSYASAVAVDGAGNLYVADSDSNQVVKLPSGGGPRSTIGSGLHLPTALAVDGAGDVFIADYLNHRVVEVFPNGAQTNAVTGLAYPLSVAVDGAGDLFIVNDNDSGVLRVPAGGGQPTTLANGMLSLPYGLAVDAAGDVIVSDQGYEVVFEIPAGSEQLKKLGNAANPSGVALSSSGDVFVADLSPGPPAIYQIQRSQPPSLTFAATKVGATSSDSPQTVNIQNIGDQPLIFSPPVTGSNPSYPANFPPNGTDTVLCSSSVPVAPGGICDISMSFKPSAGGAVDASVVLTDNALNQKNATQTIVLSGTGLQSTPSIQWPTPAPITSGTALGPAQLNATSTVGGAFVYSPPAGTVLPVGLHQLSVTFTPIDTADYTTAADTVTLWVSSVLKVAPSITWTAPAAIKYGTPLSATQLDATASIPGTFTYSPAAGTVLKAGANKLSVTFTPTDTTHYTPATASVTLTVNKATPVLTWNTPAAITYGTALTKTQLNATSRLAGAFVYNPAAGTILAVGSQTLAVTFTPTNSTDYTTATASVTLTVKKATPAIKLTASASSIAQGKPVTFTATLTGTAAQPTGTVRFFDGATLLGMGNPNGAGVTTFTSSTLSVGQHSITAAFGGNNNYAAVTSTAVSVTVTGTP